jgi:portal protein
MAKFNEKIAKQARVACEKWRGYFKINIDQYHEMHTFVLGQQWTSDEEDDMVKTFRKVPLVSNKLGTMSNSLLGEQQQNTPQLQVVPMSNCDEKVAHIRELITKDIMFSNNTATVYQVAAGQAAIGGFSAFCVSTDYSHAKSFDLDIVYHHFKDATRCYWDMGAETVNKTDGQFCGYVSRMSRDKFRELYGREVEEDIGKTAIAATEEEVALAVQPDEGDDPFNWSDSEAVTIIDHFVRKYEKDTLYKLSNGNVLNQEEMDELIERSRDINARHEKMELEQQMMGLPDMGGEGMPQQMAPQMMNMAGQQLPNEGDQYGMDGNMDILPQENGVDVTKTSPEMDDEGMEYSRMTLWQDGEMVRIEDKRPSKKHKIIHYKIAGDYELDKTEFPSEQLPMPFVDNNSYYDKTGKQICRSFFGDAKDTQRYINYLRTQSAYILKVSRYDQWIGSKKNVASLDTQRNWRDPNNIQGMLTYDESPSGAKPEQIRPPELSVSLFQQYQLAIEDLYTSTGLYPARMGNNGDEASGKAIDARTRQGSYTTYVFFNSINRAIATGGCIVNEMIPRVYDTERVMALMTPDEGMKNITVNKQSDEYGEQVENDIRKGTYEVRLKPGPSFEGQKQQALDSLREVLAADPSTFNLIADLYADNLPLMNTIEIKNRLKTRVSPQVIEAGKTGKMPQQNGPSPEEQAMQLQQQQMQMDAQFKQQQLEIKKQELALKAQQMKVDLEIEHQKLQAEEMSVMGEIEEGKLRYLAETGRTEADTSIAHANNMVKILTHKIQ